MKELFTAIFEFFNTLLQFRFHKRNLRAVKAIVHIYTAMKDLVTCPESEICFFAVYKAENGGKLIKPGSQLYLTCLYEEYHTPSESSMIYQRVHMDGEYIRFLLQAMQKSPVYLSIQSLPTDSLMYRMCEVQGLADAVIYYLYDRKGAIYYCVIGSDKQGILKEPATSLAIDVAIARIKKEIKPTV